MNSLQITLFAALVAPLFAVAQAQETRPSGKLHDTAEDVFLSPGKSRVHFRVIRGKSPTIVLESGGVQDSSQWQTLQPEIARATGLAVVSYDRPGLGRSEVPASPYDATVEMRELQIALNRLGLERQVILVGHSYGGLLNQLYAHLYPKSVLGLVLVDPNTVEFMDAIGGFGVLIAEGRKQDQKFSEGWERMFAGVDLEVFRSAPIRAGIPMAVITAGKPYGTTEERKKWFRASHENLVRANLSATLVVAERSGHMIPADRPDIILESIKSIAVKISLQTP